MPQSQFRNLTWNQINLHFIRCHHQMSVSLQSRKWAHVRPAQVFLSFNLVRDFVSTSWRAAWLTITRLMTFGINILVSFTTKGCIFNSNTGTGASFCYMFIFILLTLNPFLLFHNLLIVHVLHKDIIMFP